MHPVNRFLLVLAVLCPISTEAFAQDASPEAEAPKRPWSNKAELALVQTGGNSESFTFSLRDTFSWSWSEDSRFTAEVFGLRAESTSRVLVNEGGEIIEESVEELTGEQYSLSAKYNRVFTERLGWYTDIGWERNRLSGLESRFTGGGGFSYFFVRNDVQKLFGEAGAGYRSEEPVTGDSDEFPFLRLFGRWDRAISDTSSFETELEAIQNLDDTGDTVATFLAAVTAKISGRMALRMSYTVTYRTQPIVVEVAGDDPDEPAGLFEFDKADTILSASLVVDF
jgi:putative salt-induced outer membrane protein YdiY